MATAKVTMWVMVMVTRLAGNEKGKDEGGKGNGDDDGNSNGSGDKGDKGGSGGSSRRCCHHRHCRDGVTIRVTAAAIITAAMVAIVAAVAAATL